MNEGNSLLLYYLHGHRSDLYKRINAFLILSARPLLKNNLCLAGFFVQTINMFVKQFPQNIVNRKSSSNARKQQKV